MNTLSFVCKPRLLLFRSRICYQFYSVEVFQGVILGLPESNLIESSNATIVLTFESVDNILKCDD